MITVEEIVDAAAVDDKSVMIICPIVSVWMKDLETEIDKDLIARKSLKQVRRSNGSEEFAFTYGGSIRVVRFGNQRGYAKDLVVLDLREMVRSGALCAKAGGELKVLPEISPQAGRDNPAGGL